MVGIAIRPGKGIKSIGDLKGKKVGATFGSTGDLYLRTVLSKSGITAGKYRRVNVRPPSLVSLFDSGGVDAMVAWEPYLTRMLDKVKGAKLISRGGDHVCFCAGMHGVPDRVYKDKAVTQAFVNGMAEAAAWVRDPKNQDEVVKIGVRYVRGVSAGLFKRTIKYWTYDPRLGENTFKAFRFSVKQLIAQKKMKKPYDPAKYFDLTFINRTIKEHPEWFKDLK
jgi:ABC-type nitrate/sulfonate/bicarbonate transport system substrate-binding protein